MHLAATFALLATLCPGISGTALRRDPNTYIAKFRTYGEPDCSRGHKLLSIRKVYGSDVVRPVCHSFGGDIINSVRLSHIGIGCERKFGLDTIKNAGLPVGELTMF